MTKCVKSGAVLKAYVLCFIAILLALNSESAASEFGNVFGQADAQSRTASAQALDALSTIFQALKDRELKDIGNGQAKLEAAAGGLKEAAAQMHAIKIRDIPLAAFASDPDIIRLAENSKVPPPQTLADLYHIFIVQTENMSNLVYNASKVGDSQAILPDLAPALAWYIHAGNVVTQISAQLKQ